MQRLTICLRSLCIGLGSYHLEPRSFSFGSFVLFLLLLGFILCFKLFAEAFHFLIVAKLVLLPLQFNSSSAPYLINYKSTTYQCHDDSTYEANQCSPYGRVEVNGRMSSAS